MNARLFTVVLVLSAVMVNAAGTKAVNPGLERDRERRWKEDIDYLERELPARHLDFFKLIPKKKFEREIQRLGADLQRLSDHEVVFRLKRLVATAGVAHTWVDFPPGTPTFHHYPLMFRWYSDGLAVIAAAPEYRELLGARVTQIGSLSPRQALAAVAPFISHENEAWLYAQSPSLLNNSELLRYLKIAQADGRVRFLITRMDGKSVSVNVSPAESDEAVKWVSLSEAFSIPAALWHKRSGPYWCEWLPGTETLYIQYSECKNTPGRPFGDFAREVFALADSNRVRRVIVDLRWNGGGDSEVVKPLVSGLKARPQLSGKDRLYVLIGRNTMSSGLWAAMDLQEQPGATLVGEPTGGKPNGYGNAPSFPLPNSRMELHYCTRNYCRIKKSDPPSLFPDIRVQVSLREVIAGRDPALETALGQRGR